MTAKIKILSLLLLFAPIVRGEIFNIRIPPYQIEDSRIKIEGFGSIAIPGKPTLPCKLIWIAIPPGSKVINCEIHRNLQPISGDYSIIPAPVKLKEGSSQLKIELLEYRETRDSIYTMDQIYPKSAGKYIGCQKIRGYNLVKLVAFPVAYNPVSKKLYYSSLITVDLNYTPQTIYPPLDTTLDVLIKPIVINFEQAKEWYESPESQPICDYAIIAPKNLFPQIMDFADWKTSIGYKVKVTHHWEDIANWKPKYILEISDMSNPDESRAHYKFPNAIIGRIPYIEPELVKTILERTISFELDRSRKKVLFVKGISNYENEDSSGLPLEDKGTLLNKLETLVLSDWDYERYENEEIYGEYQIINFLSAGKQWLWDDGNGTPEIDEIESSNFIIHNDTPYLVFSPFNITEFLKQGAVCIIAPDSGSKYTVGWNGVMDGGSQSFNYELMRQLLANETVGDAFIQANLMYETKSPLQAQKIFKILGDPTLSLKGVPGSDIGIIGSPMKWIPPTYCQPACWVCNFGASRISMGNLYCEIDSGGIILYSGYSSIDTISQNEERLVRFSEWNPPKAEVNYNIKFKLFLPQDENPDNDTLSIRGKVAAGDFITYEKDSVLTNTLRKLGYKGTQVDEIQSLYPWLKDFGSIFISTEIEEEADSILKFLQFGGNLYVEGTNLWLSELFEGEIVDDKWFIPTDYSHIFRDSTNTISGFCYTNGCKIWCQRFKLSEIEDSLQVSVIDSVMHFFGIRSEIGVGIKDTNNSNLILFQGLPNPFSDQSIIRFKVQNKPSKVNLSIYNLAGNPVTTLFNGFLQPGEYELSWDGLNNNGTLVVNGVYFLRLQSESESQLIKLVVFR